MKTAHREGSIQGSLGSTSESQEGNRTETIQNGRLSEMKKSVLYRLPFVVQPVIVIVFIVPMICAS